MTQTELGWPLTKGFVSEVERGRSLPSLGALVLMAQRLDVPVSYLLGEVKGGLSPVYTARDENEHAAANSGSR
jgi:transcriptional regulator with XRE-family HTH domain